MNARKIILNGRYNFEIDGFSRNSSVQDGRLISTIYVTLKDPTAAKIEELRGLVLYTITELELTVDDEQVYYLQNQDGHITSIDESLSEEGKMRTNFYIRL